MASNAVGSELISSIVGYKITKGNFSNVTRNLPQRVAILGEANTANQSNLLTDGVEITTAQQAGELFGYGSPIHSMMRILRPNSGSGIGGVPTIVYAQESSNGETASVFEITPTGVATKNGTHTVEIAGRRNVDGASYNINIEVGDTTDIITAKIADAINGVLGCPLTAVDTSYEVVTTSKWSGLTADSISIVVNTNDVDLGVTYAVTQTVSGAGTPSIQGALNQFNNDWVTLVVNGYGLQTDTMDLLETFNGIPNPNTPTGRYASIIMKPFIALSGSVLRNPSTITDLRKDNVTIAVCPAPGSAGMHYEAAANACLLQARVSQDTPQLDISGGFYADMPTATYIGAMELYTNRDAFVKKGCSTVELVSGRYKIVDFVTTYHPIGEEPAQFRYVRNLILDWNIRFGYYLLEQINVVNHVIASNEQQVSAVNVIKPKQWLQIVNNYAKDLGNRALIADVPFMQASIEVNLSSTNPDRLETFFRYKRTGVARIASTTAEAGFNFGS